MKRSNVNVGTRAEILDELKKSGEGRAGKPDRVREFARAHNAIEAGADVVRVRAAVWCVTEDGGSLSDWEIAAAARDTAAVAAG